MHLANEHACDSGILSRGILRKSRFSHILVKKTRKCKIRSLPYAWIVTTSPVAGILP